MTKYKARDQKLVKNANRYLKEDVYIEKGEAVPEEVVKVWEQEGKIKTLLNLHLIEIDKKEKE